MDNEQPKEIMRYGGARGLKVMRLRTHPYKETSPLRELPVCDLGETLPRITVPRLNTRPNTTNRNNRSQPLLNSYAVDWLDR